MSLPNLRAIIVDDEAPAREVMQELLLQHPNVKLVGEANSVATASELCMDLRPNLIFLDVQMREKDGFDLLPKLDPVPAIIFVTAYDRFAVRAFEVNAVDYLVKPVSPERLANALERVVRTPQPVKAQPLTEDDRIFLRSDTTLRMVIVTEIAGIEAQENYSRVRLADGGSVLMRRGMSEWERILPGQRFVRIHRSLIVNVQSLNKVVMNGHDELDVEISGFPSPVHLGRRSAARLRRALRAVAPAETAVMNGR